MKPGCDGEALINTFRISRVNKYPIMVISYEVSIRLYNIRFVCLYVCVCVRVFVCVVRVYMYLRMYMCIYMQIYYLYVYFLCIPTPPHRPRPDVSQARYSAEHCVHSGGDGVRRGAQVIREHGVFVN
jgi:hypothetical protein